ncbi:hypothetical protein Esti_006297 [Eimeria stiedai]
MQQEQATAAVAVAPAATETAQYTSEETQYSLGTAQWQRWYDTLVKLGTPPFSKENVASTRKVTLAPLKNLPPSLPQRKGPPVRNQERKQEKSALAEAQEYATSIDAHVLQQLPDVAKSIGLSLRYSFAAEEAAKLTRHARAVEMERMTVLRLDNHLAEGRVSETQAEKYAEEALRVLKQKVEALLVLTRRVHMNACARTTDLVAQADNKLASLRAQRDFVSQIKVAGGAPYLELQHYLFSRWCVADERDVLSMHALLHQLKQLHLVPTNSLTQGWSRAAQDERRGTARVVPFHAADGADAGCRRSSERLDIGAPCEKEVEAIEDTGNDINQIYEAFGRLEKLSASITRSKDSALAMQDLERILVFRQQIADDMQGLEARRDDLAQATEVTAAEGLT